MSYILSGYVESKSLISSTDSIFGVTVEGGDNDDRNKLIAGLAAGLGCLLLIAVILIIWFVIIPRRLRKTRPQSTTG